MLNLEPLVSRFLDDLLRTLRRASVDELCEALASETPSRAARGVRAVPIPEPSVAEAPRPPTREAKKPSRRKAVVRAGAPQPSSLRASYTTHAGHTSHEPHAVGEITEPERLLAVVADLPAAREPEIEAPPSELEAEAPPESGERPAIAHPPRLRHGEAAVAVKGSTFVIRRAKKV